MSTPTEADVQPVFDWTANTVYHALYFVFFMVIAHGTVQLFVGVSIIFHVLSITKEAVFRSIRLTLINA